jgi:tumor protein p53-inducible protein 3
MKASGCGWIILFQYLFVTLLGEEHCWIEGSCGNMMKYVKHNESDGTITIDAIPIPSLKDGDILIKVHAAGVNRLDLLQVQGRYPPPPGDSNILGVEVAGTVEKLSFSAQSSTTLKEGDRVMALIGGGGYAGH